MGTHGLIIIKVNGQYYKYWNAFDSYPRWLGMEILKYLKDYQVIKDKFKSLTYSGENDNLDNEIQLTMEITKTPTVFRDGEGSKENPFTTEILHGHIKDYKTMRNIFEREDIWYVYVLDFDSDIFSGKKLSGPMFTVMMINYQSCKDALDAFILLDEDGDEDSSENEWKELMI